LLPFVNAPASFPAPAGFLDRPRGLWAQRRRVPVLAIVIALHIGLILLLLLLAPPPPMGKPGVASMVAVNVAAPSPQRARPKPQQQAQKTPSNPQPRPEVVVPDAPPAKWSFGDPALRDFDLNKLPAESAPAQMAEAGPPDSAVVGVAPDGSKLYAAEWHREPTDAELAFYLRKARYNGPGAWGLIACRTAPRFKVEDCRPVGESPGSGMGYAVNEAAWQFRVKPPRVDGTYQVGTWVSIRIHITPGE
jgi:periplasmic protein TonB